MHTQHEHSFEDSKHRSHDNAVLRSGEKVAIAGGADADHRFVCKNHKRKKQGIHISDQKRVKICASVCFTT